jgi:hypothetical protein
MNEFSYIDIFATKGFEYLLVIGFFLILVAFWSFLNAPKKEIRKAEAEREELRRLLELQRERMEGELTALREQRDDMQSAVLARLRLVENRAVAAWHAAYPDQGDVPDLAKLLDWALTEREMLAEDKKRLDYLSQLVACEPRLYRTPGVDASVVVDATDKGSSKGENLREALDAARNQVAA